MDQNVVAPNWLAAPERHVIFSKKGGYSGMGLVFMIIGILAVGIVIGIALGGPVGGFFGGIVAAIISAYVAGSS